MHHHRFKFIQILVLLIGVTLPVFGKKKAKRQDLDNDVLEKSEVILKFPTYAMKMPPTIMARRRSNSKVDPIPVSCTSNNVTKSLSELRKKIKCIPRDTVVEVTTPDGSVVAPNIVVVKRCGGMCSGGKKCISSKKRNAEFYVRTTNERSMMVFCNTITVSEDIECRCGCVKKKKKPCLDVQKYDTNSCKCICINKDEYEECMNKIDLNFKWDPKTCSCRCKHQKICTTGTVWEPQKCKCVKKVD